MNGTHKAVVSVKGTQVSVLNYHKQDYISLTDIARHKDAARTDYLISNWLRNRNTIEFLGIWEVLNNPVFNPIEFDGIRRNAGLNSFILTVKQWVDATGAIGLISKPGRYGGTFAHKDIAFEFASWISVEFKLFLIKEFQRLKDDEGHRLKLQWNLQRTLARVNYRIHTDAIKEALLPAAVTKAQATIIYANEADMLNVALFGKTAKEWRDLYPDTDGNIRDFATLEQLVVLSNLESLNSVLIRQDLPQPERLLRLNQVAITQMRSLIASTSMKRLK